MAHYRTAQYEETFSGQFRYGKRIAALPDALSDNFVVRDIRVLAAPVSCYRIVRAAIKARP
jgi:hypothetical protein